MRPASTESGIAITSTVDSASGIVRRVDSWRRPIGSTTRRSNLPRTTNADLPASRSLATALRSSPSPSLQKRNRYPSECRRTTYPFAPIRGSLQTEEGSTSGSLPPDVLIGCLASCQPVCLTMLGVKPVERLAESIRDTSMSVPSGIALGRHAITAHSNLCLFRDFTIPASGLWDIELDYAHSTPPRHSPGKLTTI